MFNESTEAVKNIDFGVQKGLIAGVLGPNRSGKSLLINIAAGLEKRSLGVVKLRGQDQEDLDQKNLIEVGIHTDYHPIWEHLSVQEHLRIHSLIKGVSWSEDPNSSAEIFIQRLNLSEYRNKKTQIFESSSKKEAITCYRIVSNAKCSYNG